MTENNNITEKNVNHNHEIDLQKRQIVSADTKWKANEDICERPAKILHRIIKIIFLGDSIYHVEIYN